MKRFHGLLAALGLVAALGLLAPLLASAHEQRKVDNDRYNVVVGWLNEPAYTDILNSLDLTVTDLSAPAAAATPAAGNGDEHSAGTPVTGLEDTLKAEILFGDKKMQLDLQPRFNEPGKYSGYVIPTMAGDYSFYIYGTINGDNIDETFTSGPDTFGTVIDSKTISFPQP